MLGFELFYPLDEVGLLDAAVTGLVPLAQDLLQVADLQFLQVDGLQVDGFVCKINDSIVKFREKRISKSLSPFISFLR